MIRNNILRDTLLFYGLCEESETVEELSATVDNLVDAFRTGVYDLCEDNGWDADELNCELL